MKSLKALTLGLLAAGGMATTASAIPVLHVVGSTAFRSPDTAAMIDYLSAGGTKTVYAVYDGTTGAVNAHTILGANAALLANGTIGGATPTATIIISTYWTGSLAGVVDLAAANTTGAYINETDPAVIATFDSTTTPPIVSTSYDGGVGLGTAGSGYVTATAAPDLAFSDSYKGTIAKETATASFNTQGITTSGGAGGTKYTSIGSYTSVTALATAIAGSTVVDSGTAGNAFTAGHIGVVPFEWVAGNVSDDATDRAKLLNISQQTADSLITAGFIAQSQLTGTNGTTDQNNFFSLIGRNEDSGTRIGALSESQFGVTGSPQQSFFDGTNSGLYPVEPLNTEPALIWNTQGHSGYATGGNVGTALNLAETGGNYFIGYLGVTDALSKAANGVPLNYGGVPFTVANIENGSYTFWTYEHAYHLSTLANPQLAAANAIADGVYNTDADITSSGGHGAATNPATVTAGILIKNMNVSRATTEGGPIGHL
jgi:hypothetical protein